MTVSTSAAERQKQLIYTLSRVWAWAFLLGLIIFFTFAVLGTTDGRVKFYSIRNTQSILVAITPVLLMGLGQTFVIITAGIDLSVGWVMGLSSVVSAIIVRDLAADGMDVTLAILISIVAGIVAAAIVGLINGLIIARLKVPSFIVTLGMSFIARGAAFLIGGGMTIGGLPPELRNLGNESLLYLVRAGEHSGLYFFKAPELSRADLRSLDRIFTWPVIITAVIVVVAIFVLRKTQFGRHTYAIGGNREAALRAGVPVDRHTVMIYIMSATTAGVAGVLHTARFSGGSAVAGDPLLLGSIAAVIIGGVSLFGGSGTVTGTIIGALIIAVLQTGLVMLNVDPFWQFVVVGIVVILAVLIDQSRDLIFGRAEAA
ncbi:MAG: ABC transporter permease [Chloroflexi bacterium]|nr:MAG: ABC transporter permease [Chloroflexota bacterium]